MPRRQARCRELRRFFRDSRRSTRDLTLSILAEDPRNADLILSLAPATSGRQSPPPAWQGSLVRSLVLAGDYSGAEAVWRRITGVRQPRPAVQSAFRDTSAPPPFNWQLTSGSAGVAEPSGAGGLDVIYYGREEAAFATQVLRLAAGRYRLAMRIEAPTSAAGLEWTVSCVCAAPARSCGSP